MRFENLTDLELQKLAENTHAAMHHLHALLDGRSGQQEQDEIFWSIAAVNHREKLVWIEEEQQRRHAASIPPPGAFLQSSPPVNDMEMDVASNMVSLGIAVVAMCVFMAASIVFVMSGSGTSGVAPETTAVENDFLRARARDAYRALTRREK